METKLFAGFSANEKLTSIPESMFTKLLPLIDHLGELKVTLYALWFISHQEGSLLHLRFHHFLTDKELMAGLDDSAEYLLESLNKAIQRGSLLCYIPQDKTLKDGIFFINSAKGRAAFNGLQQGAWSADDENLPIITTPIIRPNIFSLYEANIGPLTPIIAETLQEAEELYPPHWIEEAMRIAVENNVRRWRYIEVILKSWKEGRTDEKNRRDAQEDPRRFIDGEYGEFFQH